MKKQFLSFFYAFRGIWDAVCTEAHLRFHLTAAFYVLLLSPFFELGAAQYGVLILLIAAVIAAELFNTAIENVCDLVTKERSYYVRLAKDISAAAVLLCQGGYDMDEQICPKIKDDGRYGVDFDRHRYLYVTKLYRDQIFADLFRTLADER